MRAISGMSTPSDTAVAALESRVLIADDDPVVRRMLEALLRQLGCRTESVDRGGSALRSARAFRPDLILLDVNMPDMDGYAVCAALRADAALAEVPIMMLTALSDRDARLKGIEAGADDFINKTFDRMEFVARVRTVLRLNRYRRLQEAQRLEQQMEMASIIQKLLLPRGTPGVPGIEIAARYRPAAQVGGDFYDFIVRGDHLYFIVADVSGHGVASALFMSNARSAVRSLLDSTDDITRLAEKLNARMVEDSGESGMFVTAVLGRYDRGARRLALVNCGHPEPIIGRRDGRRESIPASASPIGLLEPLGAAAFSTTLDEGDTICICTDGLLESANAAREMFGAARLEQACASHADEGLECMADAITADVEAFHGGPELDDDFTLVLMRGVSSRG